MDYSQEEKKLIVDALKRAKPFLRRNKEDRRDSAVTNICGAIQRGQMSSVRSPGSLVRHAAGLATQLITSRLHPHAYATTWLDENVVDYILLPWEKKFDAVQEYRHLWLDELIKEFS